MKIKIGDYFINKKMKEYECRYTEIKYTRRCDKCGKLFILKSSRNRFCENCRRK